MTTATLQLVRSDADLAAIRDLFLEYAESLGFSLCFQGFDQELATLPGRYAPPSGRLLLARSAYAPLAADADRLAVVVGAAPRREAIGAIRGGAPLPQAPSLRVAWEQRRLGACAAQGCERSGPDEAPVGCVALRALDEPGVCEMKRLYVRPAARGLGLGWQLAGAVVAEARAIGYRTMRLDTLTSMVHADAIYQRLGFHPIDAYYHNPHPEVRYFERKLDPS